MLTLKDLLNRVYSGKQCTRFEVTIPVGDGNQQLAQFTRERREGYENSVWCMRVILERTRDKDSEVYTFEYVMPRDNLPLELIAATGLKYLQLYLKDEIQKKTEMEFSIGEIIQGM